MFKTGLQVSDLIGFKRGLQGSDLMFKTGLQVSDLIFKSKLYLCDCMSLQK